MNIEIGVGIGNSSLANLSPSDRLIAYAWASALIPSVSTSSVVHVTVNAIIANSNPSALAPSLSSAGNTVISAVLANVNGDALVPNVTIAGSLSISAVLANGNANSMIPTVSTIRNVSVGGVVTNSIASAGMPIVSLDGTATYYLQMDGVDDYITPPSLTFGKVILDMSWSNNGGTEFIGKLGTNTNYFIYNGTFDNGIGIFTSVYVNGSEIANSSSIPYDTRLILEADATPLTGIFQIFADGTNARCTKGNIYDIKFYNGSTLVAHYDMPTGTVLDQSGNGHDATLNGGTWVVA